MLRTLSHLELVNGCFFTSNILHVGQVETAHFCYRCSKLFLTFLKATDVGFCSHSGIQDLNFWHLLFLQVAQEINSEAKFQNDFLNQLVMFSALSYLRLLWLLTGIISWHPLCCVFFVL